MFNPLEDIEGNLRLSDALELTETLAQHTMGKVDHIKQAISYEAVDVDVVHSLSISGGGVYAGHAAERTSTNNDTDTAVNTPRLGSPEPPSGDSGTSTPNTAVSRSYPSTPMTSTSVSTFQAVELEDELAAKEGFKTLLDYRLRSPINAATQSLNLLTDRHRPAEHAVEGARCYLHLETSQIQHLASLGHDNGAAFTVVALVAWGVVLSRLSGEDTLVIGISSENKKCLPTDAIPVLVDLSGEPNSLQLLERVKNALHVAGDIPSVKLHDTLPFQVAFYSHNGDLAQPPTDSISVQRDIGLHMLQDEDGISLSIHYATALYNADTVERYAGYVETVLTSMLANPSQTVALFDIMSPAEKKLILDTWNETSAEYPGDRCIHHLFEDQVEKSPDAVAVGHGDRFMTYRTLNNRAIRLAHKLVDLGVKPGDNVAMLLERSFELIFAQLAILKVGATYVPIDVKAPVDRQAYIASDSAAKLLITNDEMHIPDQIQTPVLRLSAKHEDMEEMQGPVAFDRIVQPASSSLDTAYIMYTSGSTGRPKGVMVSHRGIARFVINNGFAPMDSEDRVAFVSNPAFDHNTFDVWTPLLNGARVVIIDNDTYLDPHRLAAALDHHKITALLFTTALFHQYASIIGPSLSKLKYLACAGEQGLVEAFAEMQRHGGNVRLVNAYGPTEVTVHSTTYEFTSGSSQLDRLPIGRPISNTRTYVLDKYRNPVPVGVVGELYIGGPGVANGYVNRPDLTAERFLSDPFSNVPGARMYKSGDLVRYMSDGNIVFLGRNDDQVKIRGFRIELGEVEVRLAEHPQVREVAVLAIGEGSDKHLVAYVVSEPDDNLVSALREHLAAALPEYMVPSAFVRMDAFPLTNNGKIDRRALPKPDNKSFATKDYVAPQGDVEIALASIWCDLLKVDHVGRHDNFFMLGGHSLLAIQMIARLHRLELNLSVRALFENPVLSSLAVSLGMHYDVIEVPLNAITLDTIMITPEMLPLIDITQDDIDRIVAQVPGGMANIQDIYALSALQDGILFHHMLATKGDTYLLLHCTSFDTRSLLDRYLAAFQEVVDRHDILRTAVMYESLTSPVQVVLRKATFSITELSLDIADGPIFDQVRKIYDPRQHRISLSDAPLIRFAAVQDVDGRWILAQQSHHLIADHSTLEFIQEEVEEFMSGRGESLPAPLPFRNVIAQGRLGVTAEEHERFFSKMLGDIENPSLPYGLSDIYNNGADVTEAHLTLPQKLNDTLRGHAQRLGVSLASLCHLAWAQVVAGTSGQSPVVFGTVLFGRMQGGSGSERALGLFINTLPFRVDVEGGSVVDSVRTVQKDLAALLEYEHASLALAQRCSGVPSGSPLFSSLLNYRYNSAPSKETEAISGIKALSEDERTNYPFVLSVEDCGSSLGLTAQAQHPYEPIKICQYMEQALANLANALQQEPETFVQELGILPADEYELVVDTWNNTDAPYPSDQCVHQLFEHQVERAPEAVAIVHDDRSMTYRTLDNRAIRLAHKLVDLGVKPGDNVAMLLERSFELIFAQLAILKVGATYVPIDVKAPVDRQAYIASDSAAKLLITNDEMHIPDQIQTPVLRLSAKHEDMEEMQGPVAFDRIVQPASSSLDTAYIMYTSGSTGRPKGVMVSHRGIARFVINNGFAPMDSEDRVAFVSNPAFDHNTFDVWTPLLNGARVVIIDNDTYLDPHRLAAALDHHKITALLFTTALFHQYASIIGPSLSKLKYLACAGEQGLVEAFAEMQRHGGNVRLVNAYGPTEVTVHSTTYEFTSGSSQLDRLPIGRPISNTRTYVLDKYRNPVPVGVVGELYIGGPGVANGYVNRPDLTAERFLSDPFSNVPGARMYKSGDLVRYMSDGNIVFMGRNDDQVKIRGFRIELGEVEVRLAEHPQVREVSVLAIGETSADKRLIAYVVSDPDDNLVRILREYLAAALPEYMIPSAFVRMDAFPLTNNGKINRRALPAPDDSALVGLVYEEPQGEVEAELAKVWSSLLKIDRVGRQDNFFMLGGHSLMAIRMIEQLRQRGLSLSIRALFDKPVLHVLAASLGQQQSGLEIPPNLITLETKKITPGMLPLIDLSQEDIDLVVSQVPGGVTNIQDIYALSPLQDGILFHHMLATEGDPYLQVACTAFQDKELLDRYLHAFQKVVDRHDILRTAFVWTNLSTPAQVVLRQATLSVTAHSLDPADGPIVDQLMELYDVRKHRMELNTAPLTRFAYAQERDGRWILIQLLHHLIDDNTTFKLMRAETEAIMAGQDDGLQAPQPFRNLIAQARLGVSVEEHEAFFRKMLEDIDNPSLPYGLSDVHNEGQSVTESHQVLPQELNDKLRVHAQRLGVTLASLCHLAWAMVIAAISGQTQVVFGTVLFGRMQGGSGSDRTLGPFINTLPFRVDVEDSSVVDTARRVQADLAALLEHEHASLADAQRCSSVPSGMPLFGALLNYRHHANEVEETSTDSRMEHLGFHERTNYPFILSVEDYGSSLGLTPQAAQPYDPSMICGYMQEALYNLAKALEHTPEVAVHSLGILPVEEHNLVVHSWNNTDAPYPSDQCVHQLFEHQVERAPEAVAIVHDDRSMTYRTLDNRAIRLAHKLVDLGVKPGDNVAMLLERSFELIFAQLAILKVGATYVPIDVKAPVDRQAYIASDSAAKLLITNDEMHIPEQIQTPVLRLSTKHEDMEEMQGPVAFDRIVQPASSSLDTAYIMYTSGSTGRPKGVMVSHRGIARFVINNGFAPMDSEDRVAFVSNPAFDHNTFDVWTPLLNGARVVIIDNDTYLDPHRLAAALDHHKITALLFTTALFHQYASIIGPSLSKLKYLACAGEQGLVEAFAEMQRHGGNVRLVNAYGPTEVTVHSTTYEFTSGSSQLDRLPIGRPISNTRTYVLDKYRNPVPVGVVGELYIGGPGVANGYVNRPDLTAERFLSDPFSNVPGARMYKSGDLVRYMSDGNIVFMGRNDDQVKIRGFRIELGEVEVRLAEHPQVREVSVLAIGETSADKRLIAYVVSDPDDNLVRILREYLAAALPEYMIPSAFVRMDAFPLTNNGKINRRALPAPDDSALVGLVYEEPQGEVEAELAKVWSSLLKIDRVGRQDNFFMLGGHSLMAIRMIEQLRQRGLSLSIRALFDKPVLHVLAASLGQQQSGLEIPPNLITLETKKITPGMLPLIDLSQEDIDLVVSQVPGGVTNIQDIYALSPLQDGILFHHMLATEGDPYLQVACTAFQDKELLDRYLHAFQKVVDRHDILRTAFVWTNLSTPAQVVLRQATLSVTAHSLDPADGPIVDQLMELYDVRKHRMELNTAPLTRFAYAQERDGRWILIQLLHHLIDDNTTFKLMRAETEAIMAGQDDGLQAPQPFRNLIAQARLGVSVEEHEAFFRKMLEDIDNPSLPYGLSDVHNEGQSVTESHQVLPQELNDKLRVHAQRLGVTLASLCHLAWAMVIAAISGQTQVVFGTVLFGRMQGGSGSDRTLGPFINTLPFRVDVEDSSVVDTARRVQADLAALLEHEHASLADAQRCSSVPSGMPLFGALLNYRHHANEVEETSTDSRMEHLGFHERTNYPFILSVEDYGSSLGLTPQAAQPYDPSMICGYMQEALYNLAKALEHTPEVAVHSLGILPVEEHNLVVHSWNNTDAPYPSDQCVHQLFEHQVERAPEAVAIVHDDRSMTYRTLDNRAIRLAHKLVDLGVKPGDNVAMLLERSFELIFAQLAILKVGATYVPIDVKAPVDRQAYIASDSAAKLLITNDEMHIPDQIQTPVLRLSAKHEDMEEMQGPVAFDRIVQPASSSLDTAYIMYTSGSTGRPKGVMVSHRGIARFVINNGFAPMDSEDRVAFVSNPAFDHNTFDVWTPLLNGARVVIIDNDTYLDPHRLAAALDHHKITALLFTTALFHQYASIIGPSLSKLKYLACAGEQGLVEAFAEMQRHGGNVRLVNAYGPTEVTVHSTTYEFTSGSSQLDRLPIGRPISNTRTYVLDKYRNPVPVGVVGELYIGGPGVANGYVNRPDLTAERFLSDPFSNVPGARMYKSGDLVRYMSDGNIVFMGRNDDQVKIRGFRIELGEVEVRLAEHPQVREVSVLAIGETSADKRLIAYVVSDPDDNLVRILREYLAAALPEYMIPSAFVRMDAFPLTNNGKINRRALPAPDDSALVGLVYEEPQGEVEAELAKVWSSLLKIDRVGRQDNFFMLGGHSLMAIRMIEQLRQRGLSLSIRALFDKPVLHVLAASLGQQQSGLEIPPNLITLETKKITPGMLPLIDLSQEDIDLVVSQVPGGVTNIQDIYALSPLQDGILFHHMLATEGDPYLQVACTAFQDKELLDRYLHAFQKVVDRHDILRTAFVWTNLSTPAQVVLRQATLSVTAHSLDPADGPIVDQLMELYDVRKHRMELNTAPLTRFAYAQERDGRWILIQLLHHLIDDLSTFEVMQEEIVAIMADQGEGYQAPAPFRNLIAQARLGVSVEEHEAFFRKMLEDIDNPSLPYGLSDVHNEGQSVTESHQVLPQELNDKLRVHAQRLGVTLASLCHLAWAMVIAAISGQTQVVFGTVLFGRMQGGSGSDRTLGPFINTLPFRVDVEDSSVVDTARRVQADLAALLEHEHASLAVAQRCSSVPSGMPLFGALLNYRHYADEVEETSTDSGMEHLGFHEGTNYPFVLYADDNGSSLSLIAKIVQPYDPSRICGYVQQALYNLAEALDHTPEAAVHSLGILPVEEYNLVVHSWNNTDALYPSDQCVHQLFEDQVEKSPDAVAIVHGDRSFTYCELDSVANHFACQLVDVGVRRGDYVALLLPRSVELVAAELAVLKVGATYVPIDVKAPVDRQAYIASDSAAKLLITNEERHIPDQIQTPVLRLSAKHEDAKETQGPVAFDRTEQPVASSLDAAYVMYTSGSTGRPKGVAVPHCGIARLVINNGFADIGPDDRVAFVANPSFDASTFDVWAPLVNGASIVIIDHDTLLDAHRLAEALDHYQITSMLLATGLFHQHVFAIGPALSKLKYLMAIGEQGLVEAFAEVPKYGGRVRVINTYGPTEATVISTTYEVTSTSGQLDRLPIGRPISNTPQYVLDKHSNPVPVGVVGELYIGGPGVAIGYLNRPDLTAQRFLPDPFSNVPGARMYKTGDLARYLPDGNIVFLGRNDDQVKIRGFRIELGEIETLLAQHPEVREVAVLALGEGSHKRLVAYVVSAPDNNLTHVLREHLAVTLPEYMIPSVFVRMDAFPLTNNGKVNRRALPAPDSTSLITKGYEAPQGDMEIAMAGVWRELLKVDKIGRHDSFFMLGGHSLQAMRMIGLVRSRLGVELKMRTLFVTPTIAELAQTLSQDINSKDDEYSVLIPLKLQGGRPPLFCIHAAQGLSWSFMGLTKHLHPDQPLYGLQARGVDGKTPMTGSIEEMTRDYIQQIRKVQPHGPYHFLGWSFGGLVAQNMAVELERQGEKVSLVAMMDTSGEYSTESEIDLEEKDTPMLVEQLARFSHKDSIDDGKMFWEKMMPVFINNSNLARGFNPSVYSGDILFFRASVPVEENAPLLDPTSWKRYARGKIEVHEVQCSHFEMDKSENIALIGEIVAAKIKELLP